MMQDVLDRIKKQKLFEIIIPTKIEKCFLSFDFKSWDHVVNGEIDESLVEDCLYKVLGMSYIIRVFQDGEDWGQAVITIEEEKRQ